jgi:hypothetical protein
MRGSFLKSGAAVKGNLPSWGHKLLRDSLSTQGCFSIGDADVTDEGYTVLPTVGLECVEWQDDR